MGHRHFNERRRELAHWDRPPNPALGHQPDPESISSGPFLLRNPVRRSDGHAAIPVTERSFPTGPLTAGSRRPLHAVLPSRIGCSRTARPLCSLTAKRINLCTGVQILPIVRAGNVGARRTHFDLQIRRQPNCRRPTPRGVGFAGALHQCCRLGHGWRARYLGADARVPHLINGVERWRPRHLCGRAAPGRLRSTAFASGKTRERTRKKT